MYMLVTAMMASTSLFFFFYTYATHRDQPSSPTRRSSDLTVNPLDAIPAVGDLVVGAEKAARDRPGRRQCAAKSEEHTSELQSQSNLVCRLLLEKKKTENSDSALPSLRH